MLRLRLARRHAARAAVPGESRRSASTWRVQAFDLAERLQTPVFVMSDLDIGMNDWMCPELKWDDSYRPDRGKVLSQGRDREARRSSIATSTRTATASRTARCPACIPKGAYFTRGSGHNAVRRLHRGLGRIPDRARPAEAQVHHAPKRLVPKRASSSRTRDSDIGAGRLRQLPTARCARRCDILARRGIEVDYMRIARVPVRRGSRGVPRRAPARSSSSSRTATRSCARCSRSRRACREVEAALDPALQRPADLLAVHRRRRARGARAEDPQARSRRAGPQV